MTARRVALVAKGDVFGVGGVERSVVRVAQGLAANGRRRVDVIELRPDLDADLATGGIFDVEPEALGGPDVLGGGVSRYQIRAWGSSPNKSERDFAVHMAVVELCRRRGYELLHGFYASTAGFCTVYAAQECGLPSVLSLRGNDIHRDVFHAQRFAQLRWALEKATMVTAVSAEAARRADLIAGCGGKSRVILNGIDPSVYRDGTAVAAAGSPLIGSLAKFRGKKDLPTLIRSYGLLVADFPRAHLLLAGDIVDEERDAMHRLIKAHGLQERVTITGYLDRADALRYIRGMDVFVLSSIHEGCPNALLEAMAAGAPIVATTVGAVPQMITDGQEGILVPPGSAEALRDGIAAMLRADRSAFGRRAQRSAQTRFAPNRELVDFIAVYDECLASQRRTQ